MLKNIRAALLALLFFTVLIGVIAGPGMMVWGWSEARWVERALREGVATTAIAESGTRTTSRRSGTRTSLRLVWRSPEGTVMRAENVRISAGLANEVIKDDRIIRGTLNIRYLRDDAANPLVMDDADYRQRVATTMQWVGLGWLVLGVLGFWLMRRRLRRRALAQAQAAKTAAA